MFYQPLLYVRPFERGFEADLAELVRAVFGPVEFDYADLAWRLAEMPDASVHACAVDGRLVAFKFGYAIGRTRYLSWLGGVVPEHRRCGLAKHLLDRQHAWASARGYRFVETGAVKDNSAMITLNLAAGFEIIGTYARTATPRVILQKGISDV